MSDVMQVIDKCWFHGHTKKLQKFAIWTTHATLYWHSNFFLERSLDDQTKLENKKYKQDIDIAVYLYKAGCLFDNEDIIWLLPKIRYCSTSNIIASLPGGQRKK